MTFLIFSVLTTNLDTMLPKFTSVAFVAFAITAVHAAPSSVNEAKEAMPPIFYYPECFNKNWSTRECGGLNYKECDRAAFCDRRSRKLVWRDWGGCKASKVGEKCGGANCKCIAQDKVAVTAVRAAPRSANEAKEAMASIFYYPECFDRGFRTGECGGLDYKQCASAAACDKKTRTLFWRQGRGGCSASKVEEHCRRANCKCIAQDKLAVTAEHAAPVSANEAKDAMIPLPSFPECRWKFSSSECGGLNERKCEGLFSCNRNGNLNWRGSGGCDGNKVAGICKPQGKCYCAPK